MNDDVASVSIVVDRLVPEAFPTYAWSHALMASGRFANCGLEKNLSWPKVAAMYMDRAREMEAYRAINKQKA